MAEHIIIALIVAFFAALPPTIVAIASLRQNKKNAASIEATTSALVETRNEINGRVSDLIAVTRKDAKAEGVLQESERATLAAEGGRRATDTHEQKESRP
jgi:hypothetical protein